jgi:hypothetical protein
MDTINNIETNNKSNNSLDKLMCEAACNGSQIATIMCSQSGCDNKFICLRCAFNDHKGHTIACFDDISDSIQEVIIDELKIFKTRKISISEKIDRLESKLADMNSLLRINDENIRDKTILLERGKFLDEKRLLPLKFNKFLTINFLDQVVKAGQYIPDKKDVSELPITTDQQKNLDKSGITTESNQCISDKMDVAESPTTEQQKNLNKFSTTAECEQDKTEFNLLMVGTGEYGKMSIIKKLLYGICVNKHISTNGLESHILEISTNRGNIKLHIYEGENAYPKNIDCAIIMFNKAQYCSTVDVSVFSDILRSYYGNIPIAICSDKTTEPATIETIYAAAYGRKINNKQSAKDQYDLAERFCGSDRNLFYCDLDVTKCGNAPLIFLTKKLLSDPYIIINSRVLTSQ